jgi:hypothetical protein
MIKQDDLTAKQTDEQGRSRWAVFLPAISGFYATFIGCQRQRNYVDPARFPQALTAMEQLNWLDPKQSLFPYRWSLYSGGHANLDLSKPDAKEDMVRDRDKSSLILGDSGGFQIGKGLWPGEWRAPNSAEVAASLAAATARGIENEPILDATGNPKLDRQGRPRVRVRDHLAEYQGRLKAADDKRRAVLNWLDNIADYAMTLDIPSWVVKDPKASRACGISTIQEAIDATRYNNEFFIQNRRGRDNGGCKILNVLQGDGHTSAEEWYQTMKHYCDPAQYPGRHFDGWAMGGQNMCDVELILRRLVSLRYDGLLQQGLHDWMHFLGTSKLEWAVLLTVIQNAVRRHVNPNFTISFDCASPFLATANGQVYYENTFPHLGKWSYRMGPAADDKKYSGDTRPWSKAVVADKIFNVWQDSPVSDLLTMRDICTYQPGQLNKIGKEGRTSWDSFSYMLLMAHNVWMHLTAVQQANLRFESGERPKMMLRTGKHHEFFEDIVEEIFAAGSREKAIQAIESRCFYWTTIIGGRGKTGINAMQSNSSFDQFFEIA